jgi:hypothetical protein
MSDDQLPTARERKIRMAQMLALGGFLGLGLTVLSFLSCPGSSDATRCAEALHPFLYSYCCAIQRNPPWILVSGIAAAPALVLTWWWRTQHKDKDIEHKEADIAFAKREEWSNRYTDTVRLLAQSDPVSRYGAIYSLELLASESAEDAARVVSTMAAFLRSTRPAPSENRTAESHEALAAVVRIESHFEHGTAVPQLDLSGATLKRYNGMRVTLRSCIMHRIDLESALLIEADLRDSLMVQANLARADLSRCNLSDCECSFADLTEANLTNSNLTNSILEHTTLFGADLRGATILNVAWDGAFFDEHTKFPPGFDPEAHGLKLAQNPSAAPEAVPQTPNAPAVPDQD